MIIDLAVIVPYFNEDDTILTTIDRINRQTFSPKEVIFVDSTSTDNTSQTINNWIDDNQNISLIKYRNINKNTNTPSSSKNIGIKNASTEWIAFMDCGLIFPLDWLESQWVYIVEKKCKVVSGVCVLNGVSLIDTAAVSQTYGFNRKRPCVPSTLVKKSIFKKTGLFLENRRAGYDTDWPLVLKQLNICRGINWNMVVKYIGANFGDSIITIFKKSIIYAIPTIGLKHYRISYYYIICLIIFFLLSFVSINFSIALIFIYLLCRGYLIPIFKSCGIDVFIRYPSMIILIPFLGIVIDTGKMIGIIIGFKKYHL